MPTPAACINDLRLIHRRRTPRAFFQYAEAGSYDQQTLRANRADLARISFRQRVLVDATKQVLATSILGGERNLPLILAPIGLLGMQWADGEIHACRAAESAGIPFTLSITSICSIEDVAQAVQKPFWFQLYVMKDRGFTRSLIERAKAAKCEALVVTVDMQTLGQRHTDIYNGMSVPLQLRLRNLIDVATKPAWALRMLKSRHKTFGNLHGHLKGADDVRSLPAVIAGQLDASLSWDDIAWVRSLWPGKLVLKGILDADDARQAVRTGADAIVVSNHGGRQLDGGCSTISQLPRMAEAVSDDTELIFDGGIRSGQDVMRALALGARSCMIGRAYVHGLGAYGEAGVTAAIGMLQRELSVTMALCGVTRVDALDPWVLADPDTFSIADRAPTQA